MGMTGLDHALEPVGLTHPWSVLLCRWQENVFSAHGSPLHMLQRFISGFPATDTNMLFLMFCRNRVCMCGSVHGIKSRERS